jgi:hypothetical protein
MIGQIVSSVDVFDRYNWDLKANGKSKTAEIDGAELTDETFGQRSTP